MRSVRTNLTVPSTYLQNKAAVALAEAQLKNAHVNLEYTKVNAINGIIGRSNFTEGALVTGHSKNLWSLLISQSIYVDISQSASNSCNELTSSLVDWANESGNAPVRLELNGLDFNQQGELLF